ncbi:hypothetical protein [Pseudoramibacter alactolyticus]
MSVEVAIALFLANKKNGVSMHLFSTGNAAGKSDKKGSLNQHNQDNGEDGKINKKVVKDHAVAVRLTHYTFLIL